MRELLSKKGIEQIGALRLSDCKIIRPYLLERASLDVDSYVIMMLLPYRSEAKPTNLSVYASVPDYHSFVEVIRADIKSYLGARFEGERFEVFADHSPIDEVNAACKAGLGFIGDNGLLINEKYSSFVFLCEIITSIEPSRLGLELASGDYISRCLGCGACAAACPCGCIGEDAQPKSECLSAITQKKGELSEGEISLMLESGCAWGCDICQAVCPYTKGAAPTPIEFFKSDIVTTLSSELINSMSDEEFESRAFSWRGRKTVLRNLELFEKQ